ncbi:MAG TPA: efflux RND transporter permease subunit [Rhodocyclaceae bacterium]|nr:efflux RND transporter permease subunit [Rhodocyclaceae bacterium]HMV55269.1 efflux RND transporter permease subunit [Rhodocyclaceae bacterium]HMZ85003.1 efflux RND transporter permease subunit [Rhodocyclaceae bacterium]HNB80245.1 efflux RND transporter permease subunit [Rhodocyclaceae bacterium]HNC62965.1 efflux RND transporter permease subunit [Rhodocyclaceae bacterium]
MNISHFFIERPRFAAVLSILIFLLGLIAINRLPISEYPEVTPPQIVVRAQFPGANPRVIAETVASPLEEQINGIDNMLYLSSQATSDGVMTLTVTFKIGTDPDVAETAVQNRINRALPRLPDIVRQIGLTTEKSAPNLTMVVHLVSPDNRYDALYLRNYAVLNVRDALLRIPGMGQVITFGAGDYAMRIWLDPQKLVARGLTSGDVVAALREQNAQVAAGVIGAPPSRNGTEFQLSVNTQGRLQTEEEFANVIVRADPADGSVLRVRDVGRVELSAGSYALRSLLNNKEAVAVAVFQAPNSNALQLSEDVRRTMEQLKQEFPQGVDYSIVYDPTRFVQSSINKVIVTLIEAVLLVVLVVVVFLQTWRASLIPLLAVPVSVVGTFAVLLLLGFSINTLTLFGLVLAIGIVVDDAIVVVENVERNIEAGLPPKAATVRAMQEVSGPIVAIGLTLCAVFIPLAFVSGLSGQFYRQFAVTIAISTVISAFNSLTLSPALAAIMLRSRDAPKDWLTRAMERVFGGFFRWFDHLFHRSSEAYGRRVTGILGRKALALGIYAVLLGLTYVLFVRVPPGFVPQQDKQYLIGIAQLPEGASLDRTEQVIRRLSDIALEVPGVKDSVAFPGLSIHGFTNAPNAGIVFFGLDDFDKRTTPDRSAQAIAGAVNQRIGAIQDAFIFVLAPPPVEGLGNAGGFKLELQDRGSLGEGALAEAVQAIMGRVYGNPQSGLTQVFSGYQINVPQLYANVDRTRAKQLGVHLNDIYETMQVNLGSLYVNDFNRFGRTYQVIVQADQQFRSTADAISLLKTRNSRGEMVPLASLMSVEPTFGPDRVARYNGFLAADINGAPKPGFSSGQAQAEMEQILREVLPRGVGYEWTDLVYQEKLAGNTMVYIFPLCVLLVFLVLTATYESWTLPLAIILIVPMCILSAVFGVWLSGFFGLPADNNIFTQIAFVVLVGLACKNAILIVEFAKDLEEAGEPMRRAVIHACRMRLRPILMTSIAFCAGVIPLIVGSGAGAEMRQAMGIAVFSGMVGVTLFGIFLTPVFYMLLREFAERRRNHASDAPGGTQSSGGIDPHATSPAARIEE